MASRSLHFGRRNLLCALTAGTVAFPLLAQKEMPVVEVPPEVAQALPQSQALGAGRLRYLLWDVFDATLWVVQNFRGAQYFDHAFALELRYLRKFSGASLVESSVQEMRRVAAWTPAKKPLGRRPCKPPLPMCKRAIALPGCTARASERSSFSMAGCGER